MRAIEISGDIDDKHRLQARVPEELPAEPCSRDCAFARRRRCGCSVGERRREGMGAELADAAQDIYSLEDGQPVHAAR